MKPHLKPFTFVEKIEFENGSGCEISATIDIYKPQTSAISMKVDKMNALFLGGNAGSDLEANLMLINDAIKRLRLIGIAKYIEFSKAEFGESGQLDLFETILENEQKYFDGE